MDSTEAGMMCGAMRRIVCAFICLLALQIASAARACPPEGAAETLHRLFEAAWEYDLREDPVRASLLAFRWSREQAIRYFLENAAKTEIDVVNEVDRYLGTPGQALAYKIGELKLKDLRRRAAERHKGAFDPREFHQAVLQSGAVPLDLLERQVGEWLAEKR